MAACIDPPFTKQAIEHFKSDPASLLNPNADASRTELMVRGLAGTDATLAALIVKIAANASPRFKMAVAAGLAQAATACGTIDAQAALLIQQAVASLPDGDFQAAFAAIAGDLSTAATAAAAASAESSAGSVVISNPNRATRTLQRPSGGGTTPLMQITSGGQAILAVDGTTAGVKSTTSGGPVSATR
jgi:hypothetical protein